MLSNGQFESTFCDIFEGDLKEESFGRNDILIRQLKMEVSQEAESRHN